MAEHCVFHAIERLIPMVEEKRLKELKIKTELSELTAISTLDLIDELLQRCSPAIFIGHKPEEEGDATFFEYVGSEDCCYALCHQLAFKIMSNEMKVNMMESDND